MVNRKRQSKKPVRARNAAPVPGVVAGLLPQEQAILQRLGDLPGLNFRAMWAVSNLFRASTAVRRRMEASVLAPDRLSWTSFAALWVLWIWDSMEVRELASAVGVTRSTTTGVVATLKRRGMVRSKRGTHDGRSVIVALTPRGRKLIQRLFPSFNAEEVAVTTGLSPQEQDVLAQLLRSVLHRAEAANSPGDSGPAFGILEASRARQPIHSLPNE